MNPAMFFVMFACDSSQLKVETTIAHGFPNGVQASGEDLDSTEPAALTVSWDGADGFIVEWIDEAETSLVSLYEKDGPLIEQRTTSERFSQPPSNMPGDHEESCQQPLNMSGPT